MAEAGANLRAATEIPNKLYFQIGEVSRLTGVSAHVLRFWEKEFPSLAPRKSAGRRLYRRKDVELLLEIKHLLYERRFTIEGARLYLEAKAAQGRRARAAASAGAGQRSLFAAEPDGLAGIRRELAAILEILK
ncbi:MAG: MerR family transcriptional regulator [bacterium]|jgi:DNA-binding transcriptional MerR regulator